jgi:hypothetical protein
VPLLDVNARSSLRGSAWFQFLPVREDVISQRVTEL